MSSLRIVRLLLAVLLSLILIAIFLWIAGYSPWGVLKILISSTWSSPNGVLLVATKTSLLILTGLAVALPYRAGLFNIGGEGQIFLGGLAASLVGIMPLAMLGPFHLLLCLLVGTLCGAFWAWIAAILKTTRGVHEVISTIMLNYIAFQIINELTFGPFNAGDGASRTDFINDSACMPIMFSSGASEASWGIVISIIVAIAFSWMLYRTWFGFSLRAVGGNPQACKYSGISTGRVLCWSMLLGGGCAGLSGALQVTGVDHTFYARFGGGYGFDGIAVAFLALCEPWATVPAAFIIATLRAADRSLQLDAGIPKEMVLMLEGILIICIAIFIRRKKEHE